MVVKVSILVAVYNGARYLAQMIDSVAQQTFTDYELVLVNDASTDDTLAIMQKARANNPKIKVVTYEKNKTLPGALNEGLKVCAGEFLFRCDADDLMVPECLAKLNDFLLKHPDYDGVICDEQKVDENLKPKYMLLKLLDDYYIKKQNLFRAAYGGPTSFIKRVKYIEAGYHDERLRSGSDRGIAIKMHHMTKLGHIPERLYVYREHSSNITKTLSAFKKTKKFKEMFAEYTRQEFSLSDYINDEVQVKKFLTYTADYMDIRRIKYANVILKCALHLAKAGEKKLALVELAKAEMVHPRPRFTVFRLAMWLGFRNYLDTLYVNMNVWTAYAYDDFYLYSA
jgi:glycosyltransferase involved in cell wall biosynthesis